MTVNVEKRIAVATVATMIKDAKNLLKEAELIADENGIGFSYQTIYEEMTGDYSVDWNSSNSCW